MRRFFFVSLAGVLLFGIAHSIWSAEKEAAKPAPATYVGNEVCQACHASQFEKFSKTEMGKIFLFNARNEAEKQACENCHGPGSNHVAAGGGKGVGGLITIRKDPGRIERSKTKRVSVSSARHPDLLGGESPREPGARLRGLPYRDGENIRKVSARKGWREDAIF